MTDVDYSEMYLVTKDIYDKIMRSIKPEDGDVFSEVLMVILPQTL